MPHTREITRAARAVVESRPFGVTPHGAQVDEFTLTNVRGTTLRVLTLGGIITSLALADRDGEFADVALGLDTVDAYLRDPDYLGALVGRYANRIAGGRFVLDGHEYQLPRNSGAHHLHGGPGGFTHAVWCAESFADDASVGVRLHHTSPDGADGYPGMLSTRVTYTLTDEDELAVDYRAECDRATPVNFTQHLYVNLAGHDHGEVLGHELTLHASRFAPVDAALIPTGELAAVAGTPFDFTTPRAIGARVDERDEQLRLADGYDHSFAIDHPPNADGPTLAARLRDPASGRTLELLTTEPAVQFYAGNALGEGPARKGGGAPYARRGGVALETQHFPDSPNHPQFPSTILRPGDVFRSRSVYRFSVSES